MRADRAGGRAPLGDQRDFEEFYQAAYARLVGQLFLVTGDFQQAEDVVQEAFVRALDRWPRISAYEQPETWVRRVAINLALSDLRRLRRQAAALLRLGSQHTESHLPPNTAETIELLRQVPANQRVVLLLHDVLDLTTDQVAEQLGLSATTVRGRLSRARAALARHLTATDTEGEWSHHG